MTDQITDQDRRDAREWAEDVAETFKYDDEVPRETRAAVNYILATVDAPEPTLAEDLRTLGALLEEEGGAGAKSTCWARDLAARAEQIEQERDQALAEVERLTAERDREKNISKGWMEAHQKLAEHHAETLECAVQKDAESSDLPDPADVPEGQAWVVSIDDMEETAGFKASGFGWICYRELGGTTKAIPSDRITLVSRLVSAPRTITTREELDALPRRTVIRDKDGVVCERASIGAGWYTTETTSDQTAFITLPATVLWAPEVAA